MYVKSLNNKIWIASGNFDSLEIVGEIDLHFALIGDIYRAAGMKLLTVSLLFCQTNRRSLSTFNRWQRNVGRFCGYGLKHTELQERQFLTRF